MQPGSAPRTTADFLERGWSLTAHCSHYRVCWHAAQLAMPTLIQWLGWSFDLYAGRAQLLARLTCSRCGWTHPDLVVSLIEAERWSGAHSPPDLVPMAEAIARTMALNAAAAARDGDRYTQRPKPGRVRRFGRR